jgi:putative hydrolase of the HAD superfamily
LIKAILFDLDGTLLDRDASVERFLVEQHKRYNLHHIPFEKYRDRFIELDENGYADKQKVFQTLVTEFAIPITAEELVADFRLNAWKNCETFLGAAEVLAKLRSGGFKLGIVTNGSVESQQAKLHESGLLARVDEALISEKEQIRKPDRRIFALAAERLGVAPEECVFVGDNPETDIGGAHMAGMSTVWVKGSLPWPGNLPIVPGHTVTGLAELLSIEFQA